jgi:uncharacterized membrane protein YwzB
MRKFDKVELAGLIVLFIGIALLVSTFYSAFLFLIGELEILVTGDLLESFGEALAPLIKAVIHILYLGIMGWIGSIVTIRAVQLLKKEKEPTVQQTQQPQVKAEPKQSAKPSAPAPSAAAPVPPETKPAQETPKETQAKP